MRDSSLSEKDRRTRERRAAERRGRWAERLAILALSLKGYRLIARRFKTGPGEVDLIVRRGEVTAFVEVKNRASYDLAVEAVAPRQARRISAAASLWMARDPVAARGVCRFDIVAVSPYHWPRHIENAFSADESFR
ncbi:MAG: YraN family protein [Hyphomicrobiales bacterium]